MIKFSLSSKSDLDVAVIVPRGYLTDTGAHQIEQVSEQFLDTGFKKLIINFSDIELINIHGISIFKNILQKANKSDCRVCFTNIDRFHRKIFELTGLMGRVDVFQDQGDAMIYLNKPA